MSMTNFSAERGPAVTASNPGGSTNSEGTTQASAPPMPQSFSEHEEQKLETTSQARRPRKAPSAEEVVILHDHEYPEQVAQLLERQDLSEYTVKMEAIELKPTAGSIEELIDGDNNYMLAPQFSDSKELFEQLGAEAPMEGLGDLAETFFKPNGNKLEDLLNAVNGNQPNSSIPLSTAHSIRPGRIHFSSDNGRVYAYACAPDGKTYYAVPKGLRHSWLNNTHNLNEKYIRVQDMHIIRIPEGRVGLALYNNNPIVLLPGRHGFYSKNFAFDPQHIFNLQGLQQVIVEADILSNIVIVNVSPEEIGLGRQNGQPVLLAPGLHVKTRHFQFDRTIKVDDLLSLGNGNDEKKVLEKHCINHGVLEIVMIPPSYRGFATLHGHPVVLKSGLHVINDASFAFSKMCERSDDVNTYSNINLIRIRNGQFGLAWIGAKALLLPPGEYIFNDARFKLDRVVNQSDQVIHHGDIHVFRVNQGVIAFARQDGIARCYSSGTYALTHPSFTLSVGDFVSTAITQFVFDNMAIFNAPPGKALVYTLGGEIKILPPGKHERINEDNQQPVLFREEIDLRQRVLLLDKQGLLTKDSQPIDVSAQVIFRVTDPDKFVTNAPVDDFGDELEKIVDAHVREAISGILFSSVCSSAGEGSAPEVALLGGSRRDAEAEHKGEAVGEHIDRADLYSSILQKVRADTACWGIEVANVTIAKIDPGQAFREQQVEMSRLLREEQNKVRIAQAKQLAASTSNQTLVDRAKAEAQARREQAVIEAQTRLDAVRIDAEAAELEAKAAQTRAQANQAVFTGGNLQMKQMEEFTRMIQAMQGVAVPGIVVNAGDGASSTPTLQSLLPMLMMQMMGRPDANVAGMMAAMPRVDASAPVAVPPAAPQGGHEQQAPGVGAPGMVASPAADAS